MSVATTPTIKELLSMSNASYTIRIEGTVFREQLTEASAVAGVLTFTEDVTTIEIYNTDTLNNGTFSNGAISIIVPAGGYFKATLEGVTPSTQVTITGATTYVINRYL